MANVAIYEAFWAETLLTRHAEVVFLKFVARALLVVVLLRTLLLNQLLRQPVSDISVAPLVCPAPRALVFGELRHTQGAVVGTAAWTHEHPFAKGL